MLDEAFHYETVKLRLAVFHVVYFNYEVLPLSDWLDLFSGKMISVTCFPTIIKITARGTLANGIHGIPVSFRRDAH